MNGWLSGLGLATAVTLGAFIGTGCGGDSDLGLGNSTSTTGTGSTSATGSGGAGGAGTSTTGVGGAGTTGVGGAGTTTSATTSTSSGGSCDPAAGESACVACSKMSCCAQYTACTADTNCVCWAACLDQNPGDFQGCFGQCGAPSQVAQDLATCSNQSCQNECSGGGTTTSTGSGNPGVCNPTPNDSPCTSCSKDHCCQQLGACEADTNCVCWVGCLQQNNNDFQACFQQCGAPSNATQQFGQCTQSQCGNQCP
jgi:hypothetical protein